MAKRYEITEKDIESVLNILKKVAPENATPEMAIAILEHIHANVHMLSHTNPEVLLEILADLKEEKKNKKG